MSNISGISSIHPMNHHHQRNNVNRLMKSLDTDGSRSLSMEESNVSEDKFAAIDSDSDGLVTRRELRNHLQTSEAEKMQNFMESVIASYDTNGDSLLSADETGAPQSLFSIADSNDDGQLDSREAALSHSVVHAILSYQSQTEEVAEEEIDLSA